MTQPAPDQDLTPAEAFPGTLAPAEAAAAARYRRSADAAETIRGYRRDWQAFSEWCIARHATALPAAPATVGAHLAALADAGRALATGSVKNLGQAACLSRADRPG
jgi:hypothetical protein